MPSRPAKYGIRNCKECNSEISLHIARDVDRKFYCSRECRSRHTGRNRDMSKLWGKAHTPEANAKKGRKGESNHNWKPIGSKQIRYDGYIKVKTYDGWLYEHRVIANAPNGMIVHHIDKNKGNNKISNLQIMEFGEHSRHHGRETVDFGLKWSKNFSECVVCHTTERNHASQGICDRCYQRKEVRFAIR